MGSYSLNELLALEIERPPIAVGGLLCERQNSVLAGAFAAGKTMFTLQGALCIACGHAIVDRPVLGVRRVAFIDYENDIGEMKERVRCQTEGLRLTAQERQLVNDNFIYHNAADPDDPLYGVLLDKDAEAGIHHSLYPLSDFISDKKPEFLIIDNAGLVCETELKEPEDVKNLRRNLRELRSKHPSLQTGATTLLHHLTKPGQKLPGGQNTLLYSPREWLAQVRGSGRLMDYVEARLGIAEEEVADGRRLYVVNGINRSLVVTPLVMEFDPESLLFSAVADDKLRLDCLFANSHKKRAVVDALRRLPNEFSYTQAEQMTDPETRKPFNNKTVSTTLLALLAHALLKKTPAGLYVKDPALFG